MKLAVAFLSVLVIGFSNLSFADGSNNGNVHSSLPSSVFTVPPSNPYLTPAPQPAPAPTLPSGISIGGGILGPGSGTPMPDRDHPPTTPNSGPTFQGHWSKKF